jgi:hypothetical protein
LIFQQFVTDILPADDGFLVCERGIDQLFCHEERQMPRNASLINDALETIFSGV